MDEAKLYYTAPSDEIFAEMKEAAGQIWSAYEDPYKSEKLARIFGIENIQDNFMYLFAMMDIDNQRKAAHLLSPEAQEAVRARMLAGGNDEHYINNILG